MKQIVILLLSLCLLGGSMFSTACADSAEGTVRLLCLNIGKADCMLLFSGEDVFLDDVTTGELSGDLGVPVTPVDNDGAALLDAILGES